LSLDSRNHTKLVKDFATVPLQRYKLIWEPGNFRLRKNTDNGLSFGILYILIRDNYRALEKHFLILLLK